MSHTPEPWMCTDNDDVGEVAVMGFDGTLIATVWQGIVPDLTAKCSARRIVACVNACAGIPTEALEEGGQGTVAASMDRLTEQRDKLLAALTEIAELDILKYHHAYAIAKGAIEEVEGQS